MVSHSCPPPAGGAAANASPPPDQWPDPPAGEAFHGLAGRIARTLEPAVLLQILLLFGSLVGRGPHMTVEGDRHFTSEFVTLVGRTASGREGTSYGQA